MLKIFSSSSNSSNTKLRALSLMVGYIVGVGMFGLPFLADKSGIIMILGLLGLCSLAYYLLNLVYANIITETPGQHVLPGYAGIYLGQFAGNIALFAMVFGNISAMLAYLIVSGIFLNGIFGPIFGGSEFIYGNLAFLVYAVVVFFGVKAISRFELVLSGLLVIAVLLIAFKGSYYFNTENLNLFGNAEIFIPLGAVLFAVDGLGTIPLISQILKGNRKDLKKVIGLGTLISAGVIGLFTLIVSGVTGAGTTEDGISGLHGVMGDGVVLISLVFGLLVVSTSFFVVAETMKQLLVFEYKIPMTGAWVLAVFVPYLLYFLGLNDLIKVISMAGAFSGGLSGIILILIFRKLEKKKWRLSFFKEKPGIIFASSLVGLFIFGIIYEAVILFLSST